jgi:hypothetical protein
VLNINVNIVHLVEQGKHAYLENLYFPSPYMTYDFSPYNRRFEERLPPDLPESDELSQTESSSEEDFLQILLESSQSAPSLELAPKLFVSDNERLADSSTESNAEDDLSHGLFESRQSSLLLESEQNLTVVDNDCLSDSSTKSNAADDLSHGLFESRQSSLSLESEQNLTVGDNDCLSDSSTDSNAADDLSHGLFESSESSLSLEPEQNLSNKKNRLGKFNQSFFPLKGNDFSLLTATSRLKYLESLITDLKSNPHMYSKLNRHDRLELDGVFSKYATPDLDYQECINELSSIYSTIDLARTRSSYRPFCCNSKVELSLSETFNSMIKRYLVPSQELTFC